MAYNKWLDGPTVDIDPTPNPVQKKVMVVVTVVVLLVVGCMLSQCGKPKQEMPKELRYENVIQS